ncbi:signal peptidase I [Candidatus Aerophobetes bacterium]|uniref:Signal peptidase I n=1 Tax=Aerophobetes bacterium TaxID=2030807 RepID=A0A523VZI7_UNCAE|nr:MAG: signal peptidase I [Candidatus Aerophobetes bacterium]
MKKKVLNWLKETLETLVIAFVLAFLVRTFVVQGFWIPSGSMEPKLQVGDRLLAYKLFYGLDKVDRGDVIVFRYPLDPKKDYIKRVIGLPGDTVRIENKRIYVNEKLLDESYIIHGDNWMRGYPRDDYGPVKVPADSLFVMGDNRDFSADSRYWGFVPEENLVGEAFVIYWPLWRINLIRAAPYP